MQARVIILTLLTNIHLVFSQSVTISGYISNKETGEKLIGASIYDATKLKGTTSNNYGFYSLSYSKGDTVNLIVSYIGYSIFQQKFVIKANVTLDVMLEPGTELEQVEVRSTRPIYERAEISTHKIPIHEIKKLPAIGGECDLVKALQFLPGVQSGNEGSSGLYVRGGSPDQNLILLDGVPLYYVNHMGGFVSVFNPDAINSVSLIKGGFPARYGNRLSSVLDVRMNEGNMKNFKGNSTIGLISSKVCMEGPLKKDTSSYIISFRRFLYDIFTRPITYFALGGVSLGYNFYDFNIKTNYTFSPRNRLYFSYYMGDDKLSVRIRNKDLEMKKASGVVKWGNKLGTLRWAHVFNQKLFSNTSLYYTHYRHQVIQDYVYDPDYSYNKYFSGISDVGLNLELEYSPLSNYRIMFGGSAVYHHYLPSLSENRQLYDGISNSYKHRGFNPKAFESAVYIENQADFFKLFNLNAGVRLSNYQLADTGFLSVEPRLLLSVRTSMVSAVKLAYSTMQQNIHLLTSEGTGMPVDYWIPATAKLLPEQSRQLSAAWVLSTHKNMFEWSIEGFYKQMNNLVSFEEGINYLGNSGDWQDKVETGGKGVSYGLEFFARKKTGKSTGWIGYTLAKTTRQFENQNRGNIYPYKYDRRHDISMVYTYKLNEKIDFSATWVYGTGNAITLATGHYLAIDDNDYVTHRDKGNYTGPFKLYDAHIYGGKNSFRMRDYHRLDVGINFRKEKKKGERIWNISIYNVYSRKNPYYYYWDIEYTYDRSTGQSTASSPKLYQVSLFPIMPSVSYSFVF
ncbi:MAG: TonB-dependent receptor [Bacteroidales bacterium]